MTKNKNTGKKFSNGRSYQSNWKEEPKCFNLMCVVRLIPVNLGELFYECNEILYTQGYPSQEEKSSLAFKEYMMGNAEEEQHIQKGQAFWLFTALEQVQNNEKQGHNYVTEF